jgi:hypothetical protein
MNVRTFFEQMKKGNEHLFYHETTFALDSFVTITMKNNLNTHQCVNIRTFFEQMKKGSVSSIVKRLWHLISRQTTIGDAL